MNKPYAGRSRITGQIVALVHHGYTIAVKSGCGAYSGRLHIFTGSKTKTRGPKPAVGRYAQITPASGSCKTSIKASSVMYSATAPSGTAIDSRTTRFVWSTISGANSVKVVLNPLNGLSGYLPVYINSSTIFAGANPAANLYAAVIGTGPARDFTGGYIAMSSDAPATLTISGVASDATSYGFTLNAGSSYSAIPILMHSRTQISGGSLVTGSSVTVTGIGWASLAVAASSIAVATPTPSPTPVPTPTPTPTPTPAPLPTASSTPAPSGYPATIAQKHLLTSDFLGAPFGSTSIAWSAAAPYLTWAQVGLTNATAIASTGIKTQLYIDPNQSTKASPLWTTDETEFAHDCSGNRISWAYDNVTLYQMNIGGSSLRASLSKYVSYISSKGHYDAVWEDGDGIINNTAYQPCGYGASQWLSYGITLDQSSPLPAFINGMEVGIQNGVLSPNLPLLLNSSNTIGGSYESCYSANRVPKESGWIWADVENTELTVGAESKIFECSLRDTYAASTQTDARIYGLASFMLTYNPTTSMLREQFATPSNFHVQPESQFVFLNPSVATPSSISGLAQTGGTYGREYGACYYAGSLVGRCAVVVNSDARYAHPFPFGGYTHTLTLSGGGIIDGGTVSTSGPAPPASVAADSAVVAFP